MEVTDEEMSKHIHKDSIHFSPSMHFHTKSILNIYFNDILHYFNYVLFIFGSLSVLVLYCALNQLYHLI